MQALSGPNYGPSQVANGAADTVHLSLFLLARHSPETSLKQQLPVLWSLTVGPKEGLKRISGGNPPAAARHGCAA